VRQAARSSPRSSGRTASAPRRALSLRRLGGPHVAQAQLDGLDRPARLLGSHGESLGDAVALDRPLLGSQRPLHLVAHHPDQAVALLEVVVEVGERKTGHERLEPESELRQLDGHPGAVDAVDAALEHDALEQVDVA